MANHIYQNTYHWKRGFYLSLPIAMGYLPAGIAFGVLAQVAEIPIWATLMLSIILGRVPSLLFFWGFFRVTYPKLRLNTQYE